MKRLAIMTVFVLLFSAAASSLVAAANLDLSIARSPLAGEI
jgi:hypothetical protein